MKIVRDPDLTPFQEANQLAKEGKKLPWERRVSLIVEHFPTALALDWKLAFERDPDMFAWIVQDILRVDGATPGRSGPKPNVDVRKAAARLRRMIGDDYTALPFHEAFRVLAGERSMSHLARKTGISRSQVHRLYAGQCDPSASEMEAIAKAFDKPAGYFTEYRLNVMMGAILERLERNPEATVKYYRHLAVNQEAA